ncbi:MAG: SMI1/KNR4 family protein [Clostridiales bacterium]|nr:SMI1/KNR4 family protein [Clostridiales bacterium]
MSLSECIAVLDELYGNDIKKKEGHSDDDKLILVPEKLREFYSQYISMKMPFGKILSIEEGIDLSNKEPFRSEGWFCFGQDDYFSFWLCKLSPDDEGLSFTSWDHDMEEEIDAPAFESLEEMLMFISDDYMNSELAAMCKVSVSGYCKEAMKEMVEVRKAFHSTVSMLELKEKASKGSCLLKDKFHYYQAKKIIKDLDLKYIKVTLKKTREW